MKHLKTFKLFESNTYHFDEILQSLIDVSSSELDTDEAVTYQVSNYTIHHYGFHDVSLTKPEIDKELKRIESKASQKGFSLMSEYDAEFNRLFVAFVKKSFDATGYPGLEDLKGVDDVKYQYRFKNGNSMLVWDLSKSPYYPEHTNSDERYEVEDSLGDDIWRTNSRLLIAFCMWNNYLHAKY